MDQTKRVFVTDVDSTIFDHWRRIRRNTVPQWPGGQISTRAWSMEELARDRMIGTCKEVLSNLYARGWVIRYLTARYWPACIEHTRVQLRVNDLPCPDDVTVVGSMLEKPKALREMGRCDYYVDDFTTGQENSIGNFHHGIARAIEAQGPKVIVFRNDWDDVLEQVDIYESRRER